MNCGAYDYAEFRDDDAYICIPNAFKPEIIYSLESNRVLNLANNFIGESIFVLERISIGGDKH